MNTQTVTPQILCNCGNISNLTEDSCFRCSKKFDQGKNAMMCPQCKTVRQITLYFDMKLLNSTLLNVITVKVLLPPDGKKLLISGIHKDFLSVPTPVAEPFCSNCDYAYPIKKLLV